MNITSSIILVTNSPETPIEKTIKPSIVYYLLKHDFNHINFPILPNSLSTFNTEILTLILDLTALTEYTKQLREIEIKVFIFDFVNTNKDLNNHY